MANLAIFFFAALVSTALATPISSKINPALLTTLLSKTRVNIFITMASGTQSVLDEVSQGVYLTRGDRITAAYNALNNHAAQSQANVLALLNSILFFAIKVQSFWISNQIYVQGADQYLIELVAAFDEVATIDEEETVFLDEPAVPDQVENGGNAEWGIEKIQAEAAWAYGYNGDGATIGIIDTGARYTHQDIRDGYRGGTHSWYNPYTHTQQPGDGHGHGTHCTGTIVGRGGIGVAPGAQWISCKGLNDDGSGGQAQLTACGQFMTCPHAYNGGLPNCFLAPDAVSNSWGGGQGQTWFSPIINTWTALGIIPIFALGNSGPLCSTSNSPGDYMAGVIAVGATTSTDAIASFSSRGPGIGNTQKPDVCAPGNNIRSAGHTSDNAYATLSGTSMAGSHVAGLVAILRGKNPNILFLQIRDNMRSTCDRNLTSSGQTCNGRQDTQFPNYTFGYGRINALRAIQA